MTEQFISKGQPVAKVLRIAGAHSSTYYARQAATHHRRTAKIPGARGRPIPGYCFTRDGVKVSDGQVEEFLMELVAGEEHVYGYRLLTKCLKDGHALVINHKKVYRLCRDLGILQPQRRNIVRYPRRLARNHQIDGPNQLWQLDIKYGYVAGKDHFFFIADMIDVFDRSIVGWYVGTSCEARHICEMIEKALASRIPAGQLRPIIRTDNGPQFVSRLFAELCERESVVHERIPPSSPNQNAYIESFHATLERDLLSKSVFDTFSDAKAAVEAYFDFYNHRRMHGSLDLHPPATFLAHIESGLLDPAKFVRAL